MNETDKVLNIGLGEAFNPFTNIDALREPASANYVGFSQQFQLRGFGLGEIGLVKLLPEHNDIYGNSKFLYQSGDRVLLHPLSQAIGNIEGAINEFNRTLRTQPAIALAVSWGGYELLTVNSMFQNPETRNDMKESALFCDFYRGDKGTAGPLAVSAILDDLRHLTFRFIRFPKP
jgi:hypothetical protein